VFQFHKVTSEGSPEKRFSRRAKAEARAGPETFAVGLNFGEVHLLADINSKHRPPSKLA
jgi:hypothetical protein